MIKSLEALRIIAFLFIFFHHLGYPGGFAPIAVSFFFILSGFLTYYSYRTAFERLSAKPILKFYGARVLRVYPIYLITFLASIPAMLLCRVDISWSSFLLHLFMLQSWFFVGMPVFFFNAVSWFVSDIFFFILAAPFLLRLLSRIRSPYQAAGLAALLWLAAYGIAWDFSGQMAPYSFGWWLMYISPYFCLVNYVIGMLGGVIFVQLSDRFSNTIVFTLVEGLAVYGVLLSAQTIFLKTDSLHMSVYYTPALLFMIIVLACERGAIARLLGNRLVLKWGGLTYAAYMLHMLVITYVAIFLYPAVNARDSAGMKQLAYQLLVFMVTIVLSVIIQRIDHACIQRLKQRFF